MERMFAIGILAGGKSSRMGQDKAALLWQGESFLERQLRLAACQEGCGQILVSVGSCPGSRQNVRNLPQPETSEIPLITVSDIRRDYGPLEGICRILQASDYQWVFIMAVDMPFADHTLIGCMRNRLETVKDGVCAVIPVLNGRAQPLCGFFRKTLLPRLEELFAENVHRVGALLERVPVEFVNLQDYGITENVLTNVNTPEDYGRL